MPSTICPEWSKDESGDLLHHVVRGMASVKKFIYKNSRRHILNHGDLKEWHQTIFRGVVPKDYYAGNFRSPDPRRPCLAQDVEVGPASDGTQLLGAPFSQVPSLMKAFSRTLSSKTLQTDEYIKGVPASAEHARAAIMLAAFCAGRIVEIHPFINGNGRISRLAANFFLHRYGYPFLLGPFRPTTPVSPSYESAAEACMRGNYIPMYQFLLECLVSPHFSPEATG